MLSNVNSTFVFQDHHSQNNSFSFVLAVRSNVFLCEETCPCSPLSFEKGSIVLCCKVLQSVILTTVDGG